MSGPIRVAVCDDHALFRAGLRMILTAHGGLELVGEAEDGASAVALAREMRPDVMLMDIRMPELDGIEATERILAELGDDAPRIIVLTTLDLDDAVARAVRAGASGFVLKAAEPDLLIAAIRSVHGGHELFAASATTELLRRSAAASPSTAREVPAEYGTLSDREREIFMLAARGMSNAEIAAHEFVSAGTVKTHVSAILAKLGLRDRIQLVVYAHEHGLLEG